MVDEPTDRADEHPRDREFGVGRGKVFPADRAPSLLNPLRRLIQPPRRTVARLDLDPDAAVLEIGPGPGYFSIELARSVPHGDVVLVDLQHEMLRMARERLHEAANVRYANADASALPFRDGVFDAVLVVAVLGEIPDANRCVAELSRVVRTGAMVLFAETRRDSDFVPIEQLKDLVAPHGFDLVRRRGPRWEYTAAFRRR